MYKLADFLDKYDTVIFDMDGVITSEQNYWNAAALTVYEYLHDGNIDTIECMNEVSDIRGKVFYDDKIISVLKEKGVNSNWDLGYIVYAFSVICDTKDDFNTVYEYAKTLGENILDDYDVIAEKLADKLSVDVSECNRTGKLWNDMQMTFQEWFLGDEIFEKIYGRKPVICGKAGLVHNEKPIISMEKAKELFRLLSENGKRVCTGTGRPYYEVFVPLTNWGVRDYIADDALINYDHVVKAESYLREKNINATLTKPHPYMFLKALFGENYDDELIYNGDFDKEKIKRTLVVGDAGADILASQAMGADFAAVLTGVNGHKARSFFEKQGADYILDSAECLIVENA